MTDLPFVWPVVAMGAIVLPQGLLAYEGPLTIVLFTLKEHDLDILVRLVFVRFGYDSNNF